MSKDANFPYLHVVSGPEAGREIPLTVAEITMGRGTKADVPVNDRLLSRQHARFYRTEDGWFVEDMGSTNGTWISGQPLRVPARFENGQRVRIGKTVLELVEPSMAVESAYNDTMISYFLDPGQVENMTIATDGPITKMHRERDKLAAIYELQGLLRSNYEEHELYDEILEVIGRVVDSDVSYLLLVNPQDSSVEPVSMRTGISEAESNPGKFLSKSVINYVRTHKKSILSAEAGAEGGINQTYVSGMQQSNIMCVPMLANDQLLGLIYIMSIQGSDAYFEQDDLKLLSAIAQSAALAIDNMQLVARNVKAERLAAIGMTAAGLSHYVKNILTGLEGSISLLRMGMDNDNHETMGAAWNILASNHRRLSSLMLDLLSLSKDMKFYFDSYNVGDIILEVTELIRSQTHEDNIRVELVPAVTETALFAEVDNQGIHRLLLNLCNNAVDSIRQRHGDSGDGFLQVNSFFEQGEDALVIEVTDNGTGIPQDDLDHIFESFHTSKGERGTGLGLAVCKRIIDGHHGRIDVSSSVNEWTTFVVTLPTSQNVSNTQLVQRSGIFERRIVED